MPHIMFVSFNSNTTGASSEAIINYDPDELSPASLWDLCYSLFSFLCFVDLCLSFYPLSFIFYLLDIFILYVHRITASDYCFDTFCLISILFYF